MVRLFRRCPLEALQLRFEFVDARLLLPNLLLLHLQRVHQQGDERLIVHRERFLGVFAFRHQFGEHLLQFLRDEAVLERLGEAFVAPVVRHRAQAQQPLEFAAGIQRLDVALEAYIGAGFESVIADPRAHDVPSLQPALPVAGLVFAEDVSLPHTWETSEGQR
jgi:hypothetical protein